MLTQFLVLSVLAQYYLISSLSEINGKNDNIRTTRQLNFGDCCPCPDQDALPDQDVATSRLDTTSVGDADCPCRSVPDSEGASSIFRPAYRAVEPTRPLSKKGEPKPLLNPEVGFASAVLETLQEVTNQEYQEALVRDAARSATQFLESEMPETEPRNVVNIIVSPKNVDVNDDVIPEATEIKKSTCVLPPTNFLKNILTQSKPLRSGVFDMSGSASNVQSRLAPLKNNFLENMKARLNLLTLRPSTENRDFFTSPNLQNHYLKKNKNNIRDRVPSRNIPLTDDNPKPSKSFKELGAKNAAESSQSNVEPLRLSDLKNEGTELFDNRPNNLISKNNLVLNDCTETAGTPVVSTSMNLEDLDVIPSSSKIVEVKNQDITDYPNIIKHQNDMDESTKINSPNTLESVTNQNSFPKSAAVTPEIITESSIPTNDPINIFKLVITTEHPENIKDMESQASIDTNIVSKLNERDSNPDCISPSEDENKYTYSTLKEVEDQSRLESTPAKEQTDYSKVHDVPNIKADIFKTLESFKKANEKIQEKLRSNVEDALQLVVTNKLHPLLPKTNESHSEIRATSMEQLQKKTNSVNSSSEKSMSTQDLQNMSDTLLVSSLKNNSETSQNKEECLQELGNKPGEGRSVENIDGMITSSTTLNEEMNTMKSGNDILNLNDENKEANNEKDIIDGNICRDNITPTSSKLGVPISNFEMTAEPSTSVFKSIPSAQQKSNKSKLGLIQKDFIEKPKENNGPIEGVKSFFSSLKTLKAEDNDRRLFRLNNDQNIDSTRSVINVNTPKFSSSPNLRSYKAKIASPKLLDINPLLPTIPYSNNEDVLGSASQNMPYTTNFKNVLRDNYENGFKPLFKKIHSPLDEFSSLTPTFSKSIKTHANNALRTFQDSLDVGRGEKLTKKNNLLNKSLVNSDHLLGTFLRTNENFNDKIQAFHSDLNKRLSSISSRISPESLGLPWTSKIIKSRKNKPDVRTMIGKNEKLPTVKSTNLSRYIPSPDSNKKKITDLASRLNKADVVRPNFKKQDGILSHQNDLSLKKGPIAKNSPKSKTKLKPLKENKVIITFSTTSIRPDTIKSKINPLLKSRSADNLTKLPKVPKTFQDKTMSSLKSSDPKVLASEISHSRALHPEALGKSKISQDISLERSHDDTDYYYNNKDRSSSVLHEANQRKPSILTRLRKPLATGIKSDSIKKKDEVLYSNKKSNELDAHQSASHNIDTSISATSLIEETSRDKNQSFKCKMVCIQDILDLNNN